jgi:hypothetical protein
LPFNQGIAIFNQSIAIQLKDYHIHSRSCYLIKALSVNQSIAIQSRHWHI